MRQFQLTGIKLRQNVTFTDLVSVLNIYLVYLTSTTKAQPRLASGLYITTAIDNNGYIPRSTLTGCWTISSSSPPPNGLQAVIPTKTKQSRIDIKPNLTFLVIAYPPNLLGNSMLTQAPRVYPASETCFT